MINELFILFFKYTLTFEECLNKCFINFQSINIMIKYGKSFKQQKGNGYQVVFFKCPHTWFKRYVSLKTLLITLHETL